KQNQTIKKQTQEVKMVKCKARQWKEAKAREIHNRYYGDKTSVPNFNRIRESSPNTSANR
ncbi:unnamed protein product, partial [Brachionus calyciflorus]